MEPVDKFWQAPTQMRFYSGKSAVHSPAKRGSNPVQVRFLLRHTHGKRRGCKCCCHEHHWNSQEKPFGCVWLPAVSSDCSAWNGDKSDWRSDQISHAVELFTSGILQANIQWGTVGVTLFHTVAYSLRYTDTFWAEDVPRLVSLWSEPGVVGAYLQYSV